MSIDFAGGWVCIGDITEIAPAWVAALGELEDITRSQTADAGQYTYRYAELSQATSLAREVLARHDLAVFQVATIEEREVAVRTTIIHTSGAYLLFEPFRLPAGTSAQQAGSAVTYARRYALMAQLGLATDDDDGAAAGSRPAAPPPPLSRLNVDRFLAACYEAALDEDEIAEVVQRATEGRTTDPTLAWSTEVPALRDALKSVVEAGSYTKGATVEENTDD